MHVGRWVAGLTLVLIVPLAGCGGPDRPGSGGSAAQSSSETTAAAPPMQPKDYTGKGDNVLKIQKPDGPAIIAFSCPKCSSSSNTSVKTDGVDSLVVNVVGPYSGRHLIDTSSGSTTTRLTIKATGAWKVTVSGIDTAKKANGPVSGQSDEVVSLAGETTTAAITNRGKTANFAVKVFSADGSKQPDLAVNEVGSYSGTVPLAAPALIGITSDGAWSITPRP